MAKRFGDTDIWKKQRWFRKLSPEYKLAFLYIKDQCDHAGIWNIDCTDLIEDLGIIEFDMPHFIAACNTEFDKNTGKITLKERIRILDKGYVWVTGFVQFQYKGREGLVNPYSAPVKTALQILRGFKVLEDALKEGYVTLTEPLKEGYVTLTEPLKEGYVTLTEPLKEGYVTLTEPLKEGYVTPKDKDIDKDISLTYSETGEEERGVGKEEGETAVWNKMPGMAEIGLMLPEIKAGSALQFMTLTGSKPTEEDVGKLWEVFKVQNFTGSKFYNTENDVFSHFINWSKQQKINGTHQQQLSRGNSKTAGVNKLLDSLKEDIRTGGAADGRG
jgi:hypothetical protein